MICSVCTGRHHPLMCSKAHAIFDECAAPMPGDYAPPEPAATPLVDLDAHSANRVAQLHHGNRIGRTKGPISGIRLG